MNSKKRGHKIKVFFNLLPVWVRCSIVSLLFFVYLPFLEIFEIWGWFIDEGRGNIVVDAGGLPRSISHSFYLDSNEHIALPKKFVDVGDHIDKSRFSLFYKINGEEIYPGKTFAVYFKIGGTIWAILTLGALILQLLVSMLCRLFANRQNAKN